MENHGKLWCGDLSATMECHGELWCGDLSATMEYQEKSEMVDSPMECHEEFEGYLHTRDDVVNRNIRGSVENLYLTNETDG